MSALEPADSYKDIYEWAMQILANKSKQEVFGEGGDEAVPTLPASLPMDELIETDTHLMRREGRLLLALRKKQP